MADTIFEEDLAKDVLEIIMVFSARLYGSRSRKNKSFWRVSRRPWRNRSHADRP